MAQLLMILCTLMILFVCDARCRDLKINTNMSNTVTYTTLNESDYIEVCNESYRIDQAYLISLNETGSFPDESDKTPKCFIKCMSESLKIMNRNGEFDIDRILEIFPFSPNETSVDQLKSIYAECAEERYERDPCERSYEFTKCSVERILE